MALSGAHLLSWPPQGTTASATSSTSRGCLLRASWVDRLWLPYLPAVIVGAIGVQRAQLTIDVARSRPPFSFSCAPCSPGSASRCPRIAKSGQTVVSRFPIRRWSPLCVGGWVGSIQKSAMTRQAPGWVASRRLRSSVQFAPVDQWSTRLASRTASKPCGTSSAIAPPSRKSIRSARGRSRRSASGRPERPEAVAGRSREPRWQWPAAIDHEPVRPRPPAGSPPAGRRRWAGRLPDTPGTPRCRPTGSAASTRRGQRPGGRGRRRALGQVHQDGKLNLSQNRSRVACPRASRRLRKTSTRCVFA